MQESHDHAWSSFVRTLPAEVGKVIENALAQHIIDITVAPSPHDDLERVAFLRRMLSARLPIFSAEEIADMEQFSGPPDWVVSNAC